MTMRIPTDKLIRSAHLSLVALAAMLTILGVISLFGRDGIGGELEYLLARYSAAAADGDAEDAKEKNPESKPSEPGSESKSAVEEQAERVRKRHPFSPAPPKKSPPKLVGVLGDKAFFDDGEGCEVDKNYKGAKIKEIGPDWVKIEFEGQDQTLHVYGQGGDSPSMPSGPPLGSKMRRTTFGGVARPGAPDTPAHIGTMLKDSRPDQRSMEMLQAAAAVRAATARETPSSMPAGD